MPIIIKEKKDRPSVSTTVGVEPPKVSNVEIIVQQTNIGKRSDYVYDIDKKGILTQFL